MKKVTKEQPADQGDEMLPEYDFRGGVRGKHAAAFAAGARLRILNPKVTDVRVTRAEIVVSLSDGRRVAAPMNWYPKLERATIRQRDGWKLTDRGRSVRWAELEETITVKDLLEGRHPWEPGAPGKPKRAVRAGGSNEASRRHRTGI